MGYTYKIIILLFIACLSSCKTQSSRLRQNPNETFALSENANGLQLMKSTDFNISTVSPLELDQKEFRVNGLRVGIQQFILYDTPILTYFLPARTDYIQIIRCPSDRIIYGGANVLEYVEDKASADEENRIFQANNFWEAALSTSGCGLIADSYSDPYYPDTTVQSGKFYYYVRACVDPSRLQSNANLGSANCSRQVTRSVEFEFYNRRKDTDLISLKQLNTLRQREQAAAREITRLTQIMGSALYHCQNDHNTAVADKEKQDAIINYSTLAAGVAGGLAAHYMTKSKNTSDTTASKSSPLATILGAAGGALVTYLTGSGIQALYKPVPTDLGDNPACYTDKGQKEIQSLKESYTDEAKQGSQVTRPCSCGDANAMSKQIQGLMKEVSNLKEMEQKIFDTMNQSAQKQMNTP